MTAMITTTGDDPLVRPMLDYLRDQYGIPAGHVTRVQLDAPAGVPQVITVALTVQAGPRPARVPLLRPAWRKDDLRDAQPARPGQGPTGDGDVDLAAAADVTAVLPRIGGACPHESTAYDLHEVSVVPGDAATVRGLLRCTDCGEALPYR